jgi:hypothetical protein
MSSSGATRTVAAYAEAGADTVVNNSAVLVDVTGLAVAVLAGARYEVECFLSYDAAAAADAKVGWVAPAGATFTWTPNCPGTGTAGAPFPLDAGQRDVATAAAMGGVAAGTIIDVVMRGRLVVAGTAGTFKLQFAQNTADPSNATVHAGSFLRLLRIG